MLCELIALSFFLLRSFTVGMPHHFLPLQQTLQVTVPAAPPPHPIPPLGPQPCCSRAFASTSAQTHLGKWELPVCLGQFGCTLLSWPNHSQNPLFTLRVSWFGGSF